MIEVENYVCSRYIMNVRSSFINCVPSEFCASIALTIYFSTSTAPRAANTKRYWFRFCVELQGLGSVSVNANFENLDFYNYFVTKLVRGWGV